MAVSSVSSSLRNKLNPVELRLALLDHPGQVDGDRPELLKLAFLHEARADEDERPSHMRPLPTQVS
jgi:hypothetical protein